MSDTETTAPPPIPPRDAPHPFVPAGDRYARWCAVCDYPEDATHHVAFAERGTAPAQQHEVPMPAAPAETKPAETTSERYLRHIRNVVVAAFVIWMVGIVAGGIAWIAIAAHANAVAQQNACNASGGVYVNGQCD